MKVTRIAWTVADKTAMEVATDGKFNPWAEPYVAHADLVAEFAGRTCYQSWERKNPKTRANVNYLKSTIVDKHHESIAVHASATYYITGISRAVTHELIRHRFLGFSELSQRFVDMSSGIEMVIPPQMTHFEDLVEEAQGEFVNTLEQYQLIVERLEAAGFTHKRAREAARRRLPIGTETRITLSGNMRAWRDFVKQRWSADADLEIIDMAGEILADLRVLAPATFQDIPENPFGDEAVAVAA